MGNEYLIQFKLLLFQLVEASLFIPFFFKTDFIKCKEKLFSKSFNFTTKIERFEKGKICNEEQ